MVDDLPFHDLMLLGLLWLCVIWLWAWLGTAWRYGRTHGKPAQRAQRHAIGQKPFPGLTTRPPCAACADVVQAHAAKPFPSPPPPMTSTRGRWRQMDTEHQYCPEPSCRYYGWMGRGNIRANGHPGGGPWRQLQCVVCGTYFLETHGPLLHGKRVPTGLLVRVVTASAEGLGIRAVARVFEVDPNTVLAWLVEATDRLQAFAQYFLHDVRVTQVQLDELFALLSAVKAGELSEAEAIQCLSRSPHGVWAALDPISKLLLTLDVGDRTLAMAQGGY
jgi:hypothetical protein